MFCRQACAPAHARLPTANVGKRSARQLFSNVKELRSTSATVVCPRKSRRIWTRCRAGISHNPLELVSVADMGLAVEALIATIEEIAKERA